jgi:hypothetical protein
VSGGCLTRPPRQAVHFVCSPRYGIPHERCNASAADPASSYEFMFQMSRCHLH